MALDRTKLERVAGGRRKLYIYDAGADAIAAVIAAGYFNALGNELDKGDVIIVVGAGQTTVDLIIVTSADRAAAVTTSATEGNTAT